MTTSRLPALGLALAMLVLVGTGPGTAAPKDQVLDDLLFELQLVPLDGQPAPTFTLERLGDGKTVMPADHRGRPMLLYFWASW
jgi:hypothetical protein